MKSVDPTTLAAACTLLAPISPGLTPDELVGVLKQRRRQPTATGGPRGQLLRCREVARRLGIGERSVWRLGDEGVLREVRIGRSVRFVEDDVAKLAAGKA